MIELPKTFPPSKRAPMLNELDWLHNWLSKNKQLDTVLEFGCGITSWIISDALKPKLHIAMEGFQPCIDMTLKHVPNIQMVKTTWDDIPKIPYRMMFVDASTNAPASLKPMNGSYPFRDDAIKYSEPFIAKDCVVIIHDWNYKPGWRVPRKYLEDHGYKLIDSLATKFGMGVYRRQ